MEPCGTWFQVSGVCPTPPRSFIGRTPSFSSCWGKTSWLGSNNRRLKGPNSDLLSEYCSAISVQSLASVTGIGRELHSYVAMAKSFGKSLPKESTSLCGFSFRPHSAASGAGLNMQGSNHAQSLGRVLSLPPNIAQTWGQGSAQISQRWSKMLQKSLVLSPTGKKWQGAQTGKK